ncbi:MAG: winged helix-turn-helix transcriptional regulator [Sphingobium sp.]|nr:winged helix-turn-helix transcriptional regulator [Sphingobium sp.]
MSGGGAKAYRGSAANQTLEGVDLGVLGESVGPVIRQLRNQLVVRIVQAFDRFDLRSGSFSTMALIAANPGCAQSDISRETGLDKSVVVALVDELEQRGLASRARSQDDRRRNILTLTPAGEAILAEMTAVVQDVERPIREAMTEDELETMIRLNRKALQTLLAANAD